MDNEKFSDSDEDTIYQGLRGVWRKTHQVPKPVGVELFIKKDGVVSKQVHHGNTFFYHNGKQIKNTVYSYDLEEEWFDTKIN